MSNGCISLAIVSLEEVDSPAARLVERWAQDADRTEAARRGHPVIACRFLVWRSLIRALVSRTTGTDARDCEIFTNENGKPYVALASGNSGPAISISHSGDLVVAGITDLGALGIDVEHHKKKRSFDEIAGFAFGARERLAARGSPHEFYRIWCLREAMSKASGTGLVEVADRSDRVHDAPREGFWITEDAENRWLLGHMPPAENYGLAIAIKQPLSAPFSEWTEKSVDLWRP